MKRGIRCQLSVLGDQLLECILIPDSRSLRPETQRLRTNDRLPITDNPRSGMRTRAFSLVEVVLALGVAAFCLIAVLGLLPVGVQTNQKSISQTAATSIVSSVVADMRATPSTLTTSVQYGIALSDNSITTLYFDGAGQFATTLGANSRYRLTVTIPPNPAGTNPPDPAGTNAATFAYLRVTWPAAVDPVTTTPGGLSEAFAAMSRN
jgi:uncharacterized protein (TIGR02598 family)